MKRHLLTFTAIAFVFASCGGGGGEQPESTPAETQEQEQTTPAEEPAMEETSPMEIGETAMLTIEGNDQMMFNKKVLEVYEGQTVTLTLKHVGKMPKETMGHNWTLLSQGVDINAFGQAAALAKDNDYIPADREGDIIAHTSLIGGGEETSVEFAAPAVGEYDYICSFPGHYALMKGKLKVLPRPEPEA